MKKLIFSVTCLLFMTSCYNTRILVGDIKKNDPMVEVKRVWNDGFIAGLVPGKNATMDASDHVLGRETYMVKTNQSFLTMLVGTVTFGIYTPTQTVYYVPLKDVKTEEIKVVK